MGDLVFRFNKNLDDICTFAIWKNQLNQWHLGIFVHAQDEGLCTMGTTSIYILIQKDATIRILQSYEQEGFCKASDIYLACYASTLQTHVLGW